MPPLNPLQKKCLALAITQTLATTAHAATIEVNNGGDNDTGCTLREAITSFNDQTLAAGCSYSSGTLAEPGTITFSNSVASSTIVLDGNQLEINNNANISIQGAGVTVDANFQSRLLNVSNATVSIDSMTLTGGGFEGGETSSVDAIQVRDASLTLSNSTLSNNQAATYASVLDASRSEVTITNTSISNNSDSPAEYGYSLLLFRDCPSVTFNEVTVNDNQNYFYILDILDSNNVSINASTVSSNITSAANILNIRRNDTVSITNSTISDNTSRTELMRLIDNFVTISNSTISNNTPTRSSATEVFSVNNTELTLINATVNNPPFETNFRLSNNGAYSGSTQVSLVNSIVASTSSNNCTIFNNTASLDDITSDSNSIIEGGGCDTQARNIDPQLGPLADNGGLTLTHSLLSGSPAINTGDNATCEATDQRGETRQLSARNPCDVGAFEALDENTQTFVIPLDNGKTVIFDL